MSTICETNSNGYRAPPSILTVLEMHRLCPEVFDKLEVFLDGGIRRGTDILKALSLGIKAVGLGRPFLYSMMYGEEGPCHLINSKVNLLGRMSLTLSSFEGGAREFREVGWNY